MKTTNADRFDRGRFYLGAYVLRGSQNPDRELVEVTREVHHEARRTQCRDVTIAELRWDYPHEDGELERLTVHVRLGVTDSGMLRAVLDHDATPTHSTAIDVRSKAMALRFHQVTS